MTRKRQRRGTQYAGVRYNGYSYVASWTDADGKRRTQTGFDTAAAASAHRALMITEARQTKLRRAGMPAYESDARSTLTVADCFEGYLVSKAASGKRRPASVTADRTIYNARIGPAFGDRLIASITADEIITWQADLVDGNTVTYARRVRSLLNHCFRVGRGKGAVTINPLDDDVPTISSRGVDRSGGPRKQKAIPPDKLTELVVEVGRLDDRYRVMMLVWREAGLRASEVYAVRDTDFVLDERRGVVWLSISRSITVIGSRSPMRNDFVKSDNSYRAIPLPLWLWDEIEAHIETHGVGPDGLLFRSPEGKLINNGNFTKRVLQPAARSIGLLDDPSLGSVVAYSIRHSAATELYQQRHPIAEVAKRMGHSTRVAAAYYSHVAEDGDVALVSTAPPEVRGSFAAQSGASVHDLESRRREKRASS